MTPTTPPAIPSDIPRETWNLAARIWAEMLTVEVNSRAEWCEGDVEAIAREILAAQERGKLMERERCAAYGYSAAVVGGVSGPASTQPVIEMVGE